MDRTPHDAISSPCLLACLLKGWEVLGCEETGRGAEEDWGLPVLGMSVEDRWAFHTTGRKNT